MGKEHWEEDFEPTQEEYLDAINNRTQYLHDKLSYLTDIVEDCPSDKSVGFRTDQLSKQEYANSITTHVLLLICIILLSVVVFKVW